MLLFMSVEFLKQFVVIAIVICCILDSYFVGLHAMQHI